MKLFERMKLWINSAGEKTFKVSEYQKAEKALQDTKEQLVNIKNAFYKSKAEKEVTQKQLIEYYKDKVITIEQDQSILNDLKELDDFFNNI